MDLAVMAAAQRHRELIARFVAKRAMLREAQVMSVCRHAPANQTWLFGHELDVVLVADAAWFGAGQTALVNAGGCSRRFSRSPATR